MDPRLLRFYNDELGYLREAAREFGEEHEAVAGRLGLGAPSEVDPYVERLLEGVAFLGARVQLKLHDQFPDFTQHLLSAIQPQYCAPTPSMCVVGFEPRAGDSALAEGVTLPRHTRLQALASDADATPVTFLTGDSVTLWPLSIASAEYLSGRAAVAPFVPAGLAGDRPIEAGLRLRLQTHGGARLGDLRPGALPLYLDGAEAVPGELYRQLIGDAVAAVARPVGSLTATPLPVPAQHGLDEASALLPIDRRVHRGYRLLAEYFACPERFLFARLDGLDAAFAAAGEAMACDIVILFARPAPALAGAVSPANLRLFATPAINLFEKQADRIALTGFEHERQVIADRTRPLGFEIYRLLEVRAHDRAGGPPRAVVPLHDFAGLLYDWTDALFYVPRLRPRRLSTREQRARRRSDYVGTETWLSLTAPGRPERLEDVQELSVRALVTNRDLPELVRTGAAGALRADDAPVRSVQMLRPPTPPRPPLGLHDGAWRVIAHLTPNYTGFAADPEGDPAALRAHLALYGRIEDAALRRQLDGLRAVRAAPVARRVPGAGPAGFVRGQQLTITLDEARFENGRLFLFAAVLERFLAEFAAINSFTECVFETTDQQRFASWPARLGQRPTI
ncbi:type VI secretion system baseplate subunit TssF [Sphingomonas morindae]|uniref:Type VI secretion system baseplate subunit TssF n=1 Tax=Sphingomonas morindae TaxID=1541170 RepID=A0ABY4XD54_9SPHN|nr:type VI secretion system baseplate subunit TssF [Sphingomonas morindae]USI74904.1 type VI secretion system baseplate subunit TssF [Sphingomonas morindae]